MDCLFCKIIRKEIPANIVYEDDATMAFLDIQPINPGHTLIIPKKHFEHCLETPDDVLDEVMKTAKKIAPAILRAVGAAACNFGLNCGRDAGQVIFHTHLHVMPRFPADGHMPWQQKKAAEEELASIASNIRKQLT